MLAEVDDLIADLRGVADAIDESPERLTELRERRQMLKDLQRKYGDGLSAVMVFHAESEDRLRELERFDERAAALDVERQSALIEERTAARGRRQCPARGGAEAGGCRAEAVTDAGDAERGDRGRSR